MTTVYIANFQSPIGNIELRSNKTNITKIEFSENITNLPTENIPEVLTFALQQLSLFFYGKQTQFEQITLEAKGTLFQQKVWNALAETEFGETLTYKEIAIKIGQPKAVRAVASAIAKNPILIFIPCHRIIGSNKSLCGYSGGIERKQWLLAHEQQKKE